MDKLNTAKAGSAIPVKFSLGGDKGLAILTDGYPKATKIACDTPEPVMRSRPRSRRVAR